MSKKELIEFINTIDYLREQYNSGELFAEFINNLNEDNISNTDILMICLASLSEQYQRLVTTIESMCNEQDAMAIFYHAGLINIEEIPNEEREDKDPLDDVDERTIFDLFNMPPSDITS